MAKVKHKLDWGPRGALALPKSLMELRDFRELTPSATKVLMALGCQYNGRNNGDRSSLSSANRTRITENPLLSSARCITIGLDTL